MKLPFRAPDWVGEQVQLSSSTLFACAVALLLYFF